MRNFCITDTFHNKHLEGLSARGGKVQPFSTSWTTIPKEYTSKVGVGDFPHLISGARNLVANFFNSESFHGKATSILHGRWKLLSNGRIAPPNSWTRTEMLDKVWINTDFILKCCNADEMPCTRHSPCQLETPLFNKKDSRFLSTCKTTEYDLLWYTYKPNASIILTCLPIYLSICSLL